MLLHWDLAAPAPTSTISQEFGFFQNGFNYSTLHGNSTVNYTRDAGTNTGYINGISILHANVPITNGVMHIISRPLHFESVPQANNAASPAASTSAVPTTSLVIPSSSDTRSSVAVATTSSLVAATSSSAAATTTVRTANAPKSTAVAWAVVGVGAVALLV